METTALYDFDHAVMLAKTAENESDAGRTGRGARWLGRVRKLGVAGVIFFTVKGLLWLIVPTVAASLLG